MNTPSFNYPTKKKTISSADQRKDLENEILNIINEEHSKINADPFRTDTENDRAIYSKQYPLKLVEC